MPTANTRRKLVFAILLAIALPDYTEVVLAGGGDCRRDKLSHSGISGPIQLFQLCPDRLHFGLRIFQFRRQIAFMAAGEKNQTGS